MTENMLHGNNYLSWYRLMTVRVISKTVCYVRTNLQVCTCHYTLRTIKVCVYKPSWYISHNYWGLKSSALFTIQVCGFENQLQHPIPLTVIGHAYLIHRHWQWAGHSRRWLWQHFSSLPPYKPHSWPFEISQSAQTWWHLSWLYPAGNTCSCSHAWSIQL